MHRKQRLEASDGGTLSSDRLSDLPDAILCHILSFLPTKASIRTSVLATRWRFVWKNVPNLYFYRENQDFINRVLVLHILPSINTLRLDLGQDRCSGYQIETWIIAAVARNVRNLDISRHSVRNFQLPLHLLTCETLVDLRLNRCCIIPMANTVRLPRLKKLNLSYVLFETEESLPRLLSACPVLEYLIVLLSIECRNSFICNISSLTVKRLEVSLFNHYRLKIDTPALEYLQICDCSSEHIESGMLKCLTQADIFLHHSAVEGDDFVYSQFVLEFVNRLRNVKRLELDLQLSTKIIDAVAMVCFHNLTELKLTADGLFLSKFLGNADNLEILVFSEVCDKGESTWVEPEQVPTCLSSHLRTVKMCDFGKSRDFEIIRYLLRNARILEGMEISYHAGIKNKN